MPLLSGWLFPSAHYQVEPLLLRQELLEAPSTGARRS
jgi:hypothetical protein